MKLSNYNFSFETGLTNKVIMFNAFTNALALVEEDKYSVYESLENNKCCIDEIEDVKFIDELSQGGFIVRDDVDELKELENRMWSGRYNSSALALTLAPTSDCNFRCTYCYEKDVIHEKRMDKDVRDAVLNLVRQHCGRIRNLHVTWYGGEPMMALDIIEELSRALIDICEENSIEYNAGIITNGYFITRETVSLLNILKVNFYQITLDGEKEIHDVRRPLADGSGTFDKIMENLTLCADMLPRVALRVNVDKRNMDSIDKINHLLTGNKIADKVQAYLGKVTNDSDDPQMREYCFNNKDFALLDLDYSRRKEEPEAWESQFPGIKSNYCSADALNSFVVNADGGLYKCWNDIGKEDRCIGNISGNADAKANLGTFYDYMLFNPMQDPACSKCKMLPICMGGCPYQRKLTGGEQCTVFKNTLFEHIEYVTSALISKVN